MADNVRLNEGIGGDIVAADDIGGVKVQRVKPQHGVDGEAVDTSATNPLPVTLQQDFLIDLVAEVREIKTALSELILYVKEMVS